MAGQIVTFLIATVTDLKNNLPLSISQLKSSK